MGPDRGVIERPAPRGACSYCEETVPADHWRWARAARYKAGGKWICSVRKADSHRRRMQRIRSDPQRLAEHRARAAQYAKLKPHWRRYKAYRSADSRHGRPSIEWVDAAPLMESPCRYCGLTPSGGLDRIDNTAGHERTNVVPCCMTCNGILGDLPEEVKNLLASGLRKARERGHLDNWIIPQLRHRTSAPRG